MIRDLKEGASEDPLKDLKWVFGELQWILEVYNGASVFFSIETYREKISFIRLLEVFRFVSDGFK